MVDKLALILAGDSITRMGDGTMLFVYYGKWGIYSEAHGTAMVLGRIKFKQNTFAKLEGNLTDIDLYSMLSAKSYLTASGAHHTMQDMIDEAITILK